METEIIMETEITMDMEIIMYTEITMESEITMDTEVTMDTEITMYTEITIETEIIKIFRETYYKKCPLCITKNRFLSCNYGVNWWEKKKSHDMIKHEIPKTSTIWHWKLYLAPNYLI